MTQRRLYYVLSTHWDREWYQSFQDYRYRLVKLLDGVLAGLADGALKGPFTADGQAIVLEDYLEVRPERRAQVEQYVKEGKLIVGPWYVLPDEFIVSGESLVRNLEWGRKVARTFGAEPSNAGFVCDIFGHNSQMPQIFAGFGIRAGFIWRGLNTIQTRHIRWRGADGTELPCYRFGHGGYCSYAFAVRRAIEQTREFDAEQTVEDLDGFIRFEAEHTEVEPILLFDGGDHQEWDKRAYGVFLERMKRPLESYEIVHSSLDAYMAEMLPQAERIGTVLEGELREPGLERADVDQQWLIPGVLSSREWIKQANAECQALLCQWAEPVSAFTHLALGQEYPQGYLDVAWRWLLQNHPHDSICGCSIDTVHEDMKYRFSQCRGIANRLTIEAMQDVAANVEGDVTADELRVLVFNPLPQAIDETTELTLQIPRDWPTFNEFFGYEPKPAFRVYDAAGKEIPYQRLGQAMGRAKLRVYYDRFAQGYQADDVRVSLSIQVPAMGYTTLTVRKGEPGKPTRHPEVPGLATSEHSMANEHLAVDIEPNGTLTLTDKRTGQLYCGLLAFEDVADIGDGWYHGIAVNDQAFVSTGSRADVALVHNGPMLTTFRVRTTMGVPAEFEFDSQTRSQKIVDLVIDSLISLRPGADRVEVQTTVHNTADDHRLRVLFPSGAQARTYLADSPFDVVERPIPLRADNHLYRELEVETKPQQSWTAVFDDHRGLAVVSAGQMESAVRDLLARPIALTLFRGTRRTVMTNGEPNGQLRGDLSFRYWLVPLEGEPSRARLCVLGQQIAAGLRDVQLRSEDVALHHGAIALPPTGQFLRVEGPAVLTSARQTPAGLEVRLFNPTDKQVYTTIALGQPIGCARQPSKAQRVDLEGRALDRARAIEDGSVTLRLRAKQIATVRLS
jgi:alpha-mannosidase/mannosylglycerate hydrolase